MLKENCIFSIDVCLTMLQIIPPTYDVYPVQEAGRVIQQLSQGELNGRAVFSMSMPPEDDAPVSYTALSAGMQTITKVIFYYT